MAQLRIRKKILVEGISKLQVLREEKIHWDTLKKMLENPEPPGYRLSVPRPKSKIGPFLERIQQIIDEDKHSHWKQTNHHQSVKRPPHIRGLGT